MAYTPHNWKDGELLRAEDLNHLERGVLNEQIGPQGPAGETGPAGPQGEAGPAGASGKSAYEIAAEKGFSGTEVEWLASLRGPQGEAGGVTSFNGRTGAVLPQAGDYTAADVGTYTASKISQMITTAKTEMNTYTDTQIKNTIPASVVKEIQVLTQEEYDGLEEKEAAMLYMIKE